MAENADTGGKILENSTKHESEKTSDIKIPIIESNNIIPKQETENMDTHAYHLHYAPGKKIWHYFFEFLMLFLAVFCGFIAENWREQLREHQREKEFIHSLVEDLKSDTLQSNKILMQLRRTSASIDSILNALSSPEIIENSNNVYRLWTKNLDIRAFVSNDRTIQQLKNSGELRLIRNKAVSDRIMKYDQTVKNYYQQSNFMYSALSDQQIYSQFFDFINLKKNKNIPVPLTEQGKKLLNEAYAHLQLWNYGLIGLISWLEGVNEEGKRLLIFIQKEYHLE
ncbi:MAG: hypothetical protein ABSE72_01785 [Bacteroidales bacterium]|jgi:hypothetical protein